jgi:hypothetical protein
VAVEVYDVVGLAPVLRGPQFGRQLSECRRPQHLQVDALAVGLAQPLHQAAGHGAKRHIVAATGTADHQ